MNTVRSSLCVLLCLVAIPLANPALAGEEGQEMHPICHIPKAIALEVPAEFCEPFTVKCKKSQRKACFAYAGHVVWVPEEARNQHFQDHVGDGPATAGILKNGEDCISYEPACVPLRDLLRK